MPFPYTGIVIEPASPAVELTAGAPDQVSVVYGIAERGRSGDDRSSVDTDGDGPDDAFELEIGLDPLNADSDGDLIDDGTELEFDTDPHDPTDAPG